MWCWNNKDSVKLTTLLGVSAKPPRKITRTTYVLNTNRKKAKVDANLDQLIGKDEDDLYKGADIDADADIDVEEDITEDIRDGLSL